ncbi:uncharacterized protein K441DRAFT_301824 [Cenococcum geophilum 1.58]|uniref:uncharacterized protein n=1 Tax=Cenococcum geophilum 1.58 TaxID=794803 RepID=UPI00358F0F57|nr:hypothetical protein K441DRAFT_301824 [Cenococcum geophilum 1.58]
MYSTFFKHGLIIRSNRTGTFVGLLPLHLLLHCLQMLQQLYKICMAISGMAVSQTVPKSNGTQVKLNFAIKWKYRAPEIPCTDLDRIF